MTRRSSTRGDPIAILNRLVSEGVITSFKTTLFDKTADPPEILITVVDEIAIVDALRQVSNALEPLQMDLMVVAWLGGQPR